MRKHIALILTLGFIGIAFGFMSHNIDHGADGCIASVIDKTSCPQNSFEIALHHLAAFHMFSQISILVSLFGTISVFAVALLLIRNLSPGKFSEQFAYRTADDGWKSEYHKQKITKWLSLFENSPAL